MIDLDDDDLVDTSGMNPGQRALRLLRKLARGIGRLLLAVVCVLVIVWMFIGLGYLPFWVTAGLIIALLLGMLVLFRGLHGWPFNTPASKPPSGPDEMP